MDLAIVQNHKCSAKVLTMPSALVRVLLLQFMELIGLWLFLPGAELRWSHVGLAFLDISLQVTV